MTNGRIIEVPREDATLSALLEASIPYEQARRAGRALTSIPAATPETTSSQEIGSQKNNTIADQLCAPLPPEAIGQHPTKAYLSTIKTIFMIERLNQVFGLDGWTYKTEIIENDPKTPMVVLKVTFMAQGIVREQFGGNDNQDRGDAYKGALTDALSKICGYLGIGMDVYKGHGPTKGNGGKRPLPKPVPAPPRAPEKPWTSFNGMVNEFRKLETLLPADFFAQVLADHGVRKPEDFKRGPKPRMSENANIALLCYQKLLKAAADYQALAADPSTYEHFQATEGV